MMSIWTRVGLFIGFSVLSVVGGAGISAVLNNKYPVLVIPPPQ